MLRRLLGDRGDAGAETPEALIKLLHSDSEPARARALATLERWRKADALPAGLASVLLRAATEAFPDVEPRYRSASEELVRLLETHADSVDPGLVEQVYADLPNGARAWSLRLLAGKNTFEAAGALTRLLTRVDQLPSVHWPVLIPLEREPHHEGQIVAGLIASHDANGFGSSAAGALLAYATAGLLGTHAERVAGLAAKAASRHVERLTAASGEEDRDEARAQAGLYLDLLSATGSAGAKALLEVASKEQDSWVAMWGVIGLERLGWPAADSTIERVARDPTCRPALFKAFRDLGRLHRFPAAHLDQASLAEGEMVRWLQYPTELGAAPDEIELIRVDELSTDKGPCDLFVYRFRKHAPHWAATNGWMIGVAGPFLRSDQPTIDGLGLTFSRLDKEGEADLDDQVEAIIETLDGWSMHANR